MQREPPSAGAAAFEDSRQQRERERRQPLVEQSVRSQDVAGQRAAECAAERRAREAERASERSRRAREAERAATPSWAQSGEIAAAEREFGGAFRSLSAASTAEASGDGGDRDGADVSMATNGEEDPGYATECYGADTEGEAMEE